jgi:molecular chaperone IbpA
MANILKRESRLRSPLSSLLSDGEKWMVGFDDVFNNLVEKWEEGFDGFHEYPASNIKRIDDSHYRIEISLAGFHRNELSVDREGDTLVVMGSKSEETAKEQEDYLQRGIKAKSFRQSFQLTEHDQVLDAALKDGILEINIKRESNGSRKKLGIPIKEA